MGDTRTCRFRGCKTKARDCTEYSCVRDGPMIILIAFRCAHRFTHSVLPIIDRLRCIFSASMARVPMQKYFKRSWVRIYSGASCYTLIVNRLGAIQYQLGDGHTYHFVEGTILENTQKGSYVIYATIKTY